MDDSRIDYEDLDGRPAMELEDEEQGGFNWTLVVGLLAAATCIYFVVIDGMKSETYFYTADQAVAQGTELVGQTVRIKGIVEPGTVVGIDGQLRREFRVAEKGKSIKVTYDKAMPDTFDEDMEVVVNGTVDENLVVIADEVLVKCPSRYEGAPPSFEDEEGVTPEQAAL